MRNKDRLEIQAHYMIEIIWMKTIIFLLHQSYQNLNWDFFPVGLYDGKLTRGTVTLVHSLQNIDYHTTEQRFLTDFNLWYSNMHCLVIEILDFRTSFDIQIYGIKEEKIVGKQLLFKG